MLEEIKPQECKALHSVSISMAYRRQTVASSQEKEVKFLPGAFKDQFPPCYKNYLKSSLWSRFQDTQFAQQEASAQGNGACGPHLVLQVTTLQPSSPRTHLQLLQGLRESPSISPETKVQKNTMQDGLILRLHSTAKGEWEVKFSSLLLQHIRGPGSDKMWLMAFLSGSPTSYQWTHYSNNSKVK